jgi:hypothetical protein
MNSRIWIDSADAESLFADHMILSGFVRGGFSCVRRFCPIAGIPQFQWQRQRYVFSCLVFKHLHTCESALAALHPNSGFSQRFEPALSAVTGRPRVPLVIAFPNGELSPPSAAAIGTIWRSFLVQRRARSARLPEARVSRLIGKFDTTASGRKWQVAILVLL